MLVCLENIRTHWFWGLCSAFGWSLILLLSTRSKVRMLYPQYVAISWLCFVFKTYIEVHWFKMQWIIMLHGDKYIGTTLLWTQTNTWLMNRLDVSWLATYHSWAGIGNLSLERDPLVVGPLFVSKGPQEGPPDVIHGVETHSWAFKHTAAGDNADGRTHT